jgi:hypothetical protein
MNMPQAPRSARSALALLLAAGTLFTANLRAAAATPFDVLKGSWGGDGSLSFESGQDEKLACSGYYKSSDGGNSLTLAIRCTGPQSKLELRSKLGYMGGKVSGSWEERTFNASGSASGVATPSSLRLQVSGSLSGSMSIEFSPSSQSVSISISTSGAGLKGAQFSLSRR